MTDDDAILDGDALLAELRAGDADAALARLLTEADPHRALDAAIEAATRIAAAEAAGGLEASAAVVALADALDAPGPRARARRARARALAYAGRFDESLGACLEAIEIARAAAEPIEVGRARLASMHALGELGRLDAARDAGEEARRVFLEAGAPELSARADINLGIIHHRREEPDAALRCFERAAPHFDREPLILGHLENSRGEALLALHDFDGAEHAFDAALRLFDAHGATLTAAIAEGNLADLAAREGRLQRALFRFEGARRHLDRDAAPAVLARLLAEQAEAKSALGAHEEAIADFAAALPALERHGLPIEAARARAGTGRALLRLGRTTEAETALAAAATAYDDLGHLFARARVDLLRAEVALDSDRNDEARRLAARALGVLHDRPADAALARRLLAATAARAGAFEEAEADLAAAIAAARRLDLAPLLADLLDARGRLHARRGAQDAAIEDLEGATIAIERIRGSLQADRFRAAFLGDRAATHAALVAAHLDRGGPTAVADAFRVAERARSRLLLDQLRSPDDFDAAAAGAGAADAPLLRRLAVLRAELNGLYSRLADEKAAGGEAWRHAVRLRETELSETESRLALRHRSGWLFAEPASIDAARAALGPDDALVVFAAAGAELVVFAVRRDAPPIARRLGSRDEIARAVAFARFQFDRALPQESRSGPRADRRLAQAQAALAALHDRLLAPVAEAIDGATRLAVVPHGPLHALPFAALRRGNRWLVEHGAVHVAPSASVLLHLAATDRIAPARGHAAVIGVGDARAARIEEEARAVAKLLDVRGDRLLVGDAATADAVREAADGASLLHLACHGRHQPDLPEASGVHLADRWMTMRDLRGLRLDGAVVVLSGCETGLHRVDAGEELLGLQSALLAAGARTVVTSLWRVDDASAAILMDRLHRAWQDEGCGPGSRLAALRRAQLEVMADRPHPAHWAPFVLAGAP